MQPCVSPLQPCLHPIYARLLCAALRQRGFGEAQILQGTGLDWAHLHSDNRRLNFAQVQRLVRRAVQLTEWGRTHKFCGRCGTPTELSGRAPISSLTMPSTMTLAVRLVSIELRWVARAEVTTIASIVSSAGGVAGAV